jgi:putative tryptophan/tyrosine transport system substrate-binding protein
MMDRRTFIGSIAGGVLAVPRGAFARQQGKVWRVGFLIYRRLAPSETDYYRAFPKGMRELGYVEGRNLLIEWRSADGKFERLPNLAAELVQLKVDVIVTGGTVATSAAQKATTAVPIVMGATNDAVASGFVKSLARPGGNITGISDLAVDLSAKDLEILLSVVPKLSRLAVLVNPRNLTHGKIVKDLQTAALKTDVKILPLEAQTPQEIENAFSTMRQQSAEAFFVGLDAFLIQQAGQIADLATRYRIASMFGIREHAEVGGLMSYGPSLSECYRRAATYVDKILKGAQPGDLPVEQPTKFELVINMKTAKALGLTIPPSLLFRADVVIE